MRPADDGVLAMRPHDGPAPAIGAQAQRRANRRLGWVLASVALAFFAGFVAKFVLFGH